MYSWTPDPERLEAARRQSSSVSESHCGVGKKRRRAEWKQTLDDVILNSGLLSKDKVFLVSELFSNSVILDCGQA